MTDLNSALIELEQKEKDISKSKAKLKRALRERKIDDDVIIAKQLLKIDKLYEQGKSDDCVKEIRRLSDYVIKYEGDDEIVNVDLLQDTFKFAEDEPEPRRYPLLNTDLDLYYVPRLYSLVGGGTGVGKTTFLLNTIYEAINRGMQVDVFSIEMPSAQLMFKLFAIHLKISHGLGNDALFIWNAIKNDIGNIRKLYTDFYNKLLKDNLNIIHSRKGHWTPKTLWHASTWRENERSKSADLIMVDYFQLLHYDRKKNGEPVNRSDKVNYFSVIADDMRELVMRSSAHWVFLSQLAQDEHKSDLMNETTGFKYTGELPNHAGFAIKLFRDKKTNQIAAYIVKNRFGKVGKYDLNIDFKTGAYLR